ncbi:MAG: hypothetical protein KKA07_06790 [Bacteroidetes bacterium]|nr:hypothetical protein [Bacteroidota bacterium]MBU1718764.1 hypothetical protein [Bacteroidota bacterium]
MKKYLIASFLILLSATVASSQEYDLTIAKYFYYRNRLAKYFISPGSADQRGAGLVASIRNSYACKAATSIGFGQQALFLC